MIGELHLAKNNPKEAVDAFNTAIALSPELEVRCGYSIRSIFERAQPASRPNKNTDTSFKY